MDDRYTHLAIRDVYAEIDVAEGPRTDFANQPVFGSDDEIAFR